MELNVLKQIITYKHDYHKLICSIAIMAQSPEDLLSFLL